MENNTKITVIQMNDSHAYFNLHQELFWKADGAEYRQVGGYARIATLVKQIRESNNGHVLFCDNGDTLNGTYPAIKTLGSAMIPVVNALGLDAMSSHWEFAYGPSVFKKRAEELNFPVLAINIFDKKTNKLIFSPYLVKTIGKIRVGIIGIASNIVDTTMPPSFSEGVRFTLGKDELPEVINTLKNVEYVDLIILISHLGFPQDMKMMSEVDGIDLCLSGHTHNRTVQPILQGKTLIIQSGCHGSFLGRIDLEINDKKISNYTFELIEVESSILPDPEITEIIERELEPFKEELDTVVGETETALNRYTMLESTMDNFLLQAILEASGAELAFSNGWRYGAPVIPGPITMNDLYNIIPMNPPIGKVDISGYELVKMLEDNLERTFAADPYDQMGGYIKRGLGLTVYLKFENPAGQRIQQLFVANEPVDPQRIYHAAFVTDQGVPQKFGSNRSVMKMHAIEAMQTYLATHKSLRAELRGTYIPV
ncbi:MAG: bifunctional metallophosphatase/5'-nucleotidase [Erysipelotrichaceae bacterium]|nr:bifunctional metallophosphatase/5'-nucleotidase [Erysipelotrichaceae bacterium]